MRPGNISYFQRIEVLKMSLESIKTNKNVLCAVTFFFFFFFLLFILVIEYRSFVISAFRTKDVSGLLLFLLIDIIVLILAFLIVFIFYAIKGEDGES